MVDKKVTDENVRFLGVFDKIELKMNVFINIFQTAEDMKELRPESEFKI